MMANADVLIEIRPIRLSDCTQEYADWLADPDVIAFLETRHERQTLDRIRSYVRNIMRSDDQFLFAITANARHIGNCKIGPINRHHSYASLAYFIGNVAYWNRGAATKAVGLVVEYGFTTLGLHRIEAGIYNGNVASRAVLVRNGFSEDGCLRKQLKDVNGAWQDHTLFGLNVEDWQAATAAKKPASF